MVALKLAWAVAMSLLRVAEELALAWAELSLALARLYWYAQLTTSLVAADVAMGKPPGGKFGPSPPGEDPLALS